MIVRLASPPLVQVKGDEQCGQAPNKEMERYKDVHITPAMGALCLLPEDTFHSFVASALKYSLTSVYLLIYCLSSFYFTFEDSPAVLRPVHVLIEL